MSEGFAVGDVVVLKSGGPDMTITYVDSRLTCYWWVQSEGKYHHQEFPIEALRKAPTND